MTTSTPTLGDKVVVYYGVLHGQVEGTLYAKGSDKWGSTFRIKIENSEFVEVSNLTAIENRAGQKAGAYYLPTSPLRTVRLGV